MGTFSYLWVCILYAFYLEVYKMQAYLGKQIVTDNWTVLLIFQMFFHPDL